MKDEALTNFINILEKSMDKELLAVIGKLYLENISLYNTIQSLQDRLNQVINDTTVTIPDKEQ